MRCDGEFKLGVWAQWTLREEREVLGLNRESSDKLGVGDGGGTDFAGWVFSARV